MDSIIALLKTPEFWFTSVLAQVVVGLLTNWISLNAHVKWLDFALAINALLLLAFSIPAVTGLDWSRHDLTTIAIAVFYVSLIWFATTTLKVFTLLATNLAVLAIVFLAHGKQGFSWQGAVGAYCITAQLFCCIEMFWLWISYESRQAKP
ncbi:MAG: hypothetical protein HOP09_15835 [Hyphomicrobium sp.]|nr:hypothetical protein [Hyphomicrobium sp.]